MAQRIHICLLQRLGMFAAEGRGQMGDIPKVWSSSSFFKYRNFSEVLVFSSTAALPVAY